MTATRLPKYERGDGFEIEVDGQTLTAFEGETVATALLAAGIQTFRHAHPGGEPNRLFCGMGVCMQCLVTVDGVNSCRACCTPVYPGIKVETRT